MSSDGYLIVPEDLGFSAPFFQNSTPLHVCFLFPPTASHSTSKTMEASENKDQIGSFIAIDDSRTSAPQFTSKVALQRLASLVPTSRIQRSVARTLCFGSALPSITPGTRSCRSLRGCDFPYNPNWRFKELSTPQQTPRVTSTQRVVMKGVHYCH